MRVAWDQQLVLDTSGGSHVEGTIPEDTGPAGSSPGMYAGRSYWLMFVSKIAHNIIGTPPVAGTGVPPGGNTASGSPTAATAAKALIPITNNIPHPQEIPAGTIISAITDGGAATTGAKVSFVRCYP